MSVYMTRWFVRWARKEGLVAATLCDAVDEMRRGLVDANLGGGVLKKRVGRSGQGKRGGLRTLVATRRGERWFFLYGFAKNQRENIDTQEEAALKSLAAHMLASGPQAMLQAVAAGELTEVNCNGQDPIPHPAGGA